MNTHWKQIRWNQYRLVLANGSIENFERYVDLFNYCQQHKINATQV